MQFSKEQNLTFEQAVEKMFEKLGDSKIMALASAVGTHVMVRNVSCLFYNNKIYFKTDKNFRKTQQLFENPNVALCWSGVQVEGVVEIWDTSLDNYAYQLFIDFEKQEVVFKPYDER